MTVELHLLNTSGALDGLKGRIQNAFHQGCTQILSLLPLEKVDVIIRTDGWALQQTGIGGYSPSAHVAQLTLNPQNENLLVDFEREFTATLGHELHHCLRWRGPGYGRTLGEVLVTEGLACHFETELRGGKAPFNATALDNAATAGMWENAKHDLGSCKYSHSDWFFGAAEKGMPHYTGYTLGFRIVSNYIGEKKIPASQLWGSAAGDFYIGDYVSEAKRIELIKGVAVN